MRGNLRTIGLAMIFSTDQQTREGPNRRPAQDNPQRDASDLTHGEATQHGFSGGTPMGAAMAGTADFGHAVCYGPVAESEKRVRRAYHTMFERR